MIYPLSQISKGPRGTAGALSRDAEDNQLAYYCINSIDEQRYALLLYLAVLYLHKEKSVTNHFFRSGWPCRTVRSMRGSCPLNQSRGC